MARVCVGNDEELNLDHEDGCTAVMDVCNAMNCKLKND